MRDLKAKISEIFYSIQGEGIYLGYPQVFIRFWGCNLDSCKYCDTKFNKFKEYTLDSLKKEIRGLNKGCHSISITGGEPLIQVDFIKKLLKNLEKSEKIYLETNGVLSDQLEKVIENVDIVAMDMKLPSATGLKPFWDEHRRFLLIAWEKQVFVKIVVTEKTTMKDFRRALEIILSVDTSIPLVIQPYFEDSSPKLVDKLLKFQKEAVRSLMHVRVIPQLHKGINIR
ncbi:MAG: 7-carboxy-7-deazaguanine synthase QueE [Candidatus Kaelpia imicola]|nr:7-carboxy-7-deazaguanine synthase QueE [Candidatus Kaelpia imicola]